MHIAQSLVPLAVMTGFAVMLIDPRRGFGNQERFPGITVLNDWPDEAVRALRPDGRTAIVTLTHDPSWTTPRWMRRCAQRPSISVRSARGKPMLPGWSGWRRTAMTRPLWPVSAARWG